MSVNLEHLRARSVAPELWVAQAALLGALLSGPLVAVSPRLTLVAAIAAAVAVLVICRPVAAAYLFLGVSPLVVGMERGSIVPLLRPNEALLLLLAAALLARRILDPPAARPSLRSLHPVDVSILMLAVAASVIPLLWMVARDVAITQDDLLYATALWKYYAIYLLVRSSVRTEAQVARCLWISMIVAAVVGLIGIVQSLGAWGVPQMLATHYAGGGDVAEVDINRASSTIGQSFAFGDVMIFSLAIAVAWLLHKGRPKPLLVAGALFFAVATVASGQFSEVLGLVAGALALGLVTGRLRTAAALLVPVMAVALFALQPVVERRLSAVDANKGVPTSWVSRWENLDTFFLPDITEASAVLGVRPAARVPSPELFGEWVYIESGHLWLLWTGGIPLFVAFFVFLWKGLGATAAVARRRADAVGVAAIASFVSLVVLAVVTLFDPHLTMRGSADLLFPLLALALIGQRYRAAAAQSLPTTS